MPTVPTGLLALATDALATLGRDERSPVRTRSPSAEASIDSEFLIEEANAIWRSSCSLCAVRRSLRSANWAAARSFAHGDAVVYLAQPWVMTPAVARRLHERDDRVVTQLAVETRLGTFWVDLGWPEQRVLGEYDGRSKYADAGAPAAVVIEEKRREDALVEQGFRVIRIDADDVRHPETLAARLRRLGSFPPPILRPELSLYGPPRSPLR